MKVAIDARREGLTELCDVTFSSLLNNPSQPVSDELSTTIAVFEFTTTRETEVQRPVWVVACLVWPLPNRRFPLQLFHDDQLVTDGFTLVRKVILSPALLGSSC